MKRILFFIFVFFFFESFAFSLSFSGALKKSSYNLCFTPGAKCEAMIVKGIQNAKESIYVQAYSFTSKPMAEHNVIC